MPRLLCTILLFLAAVALAGSTSAPSALTPDAVLRNLDLTIDWYHRVQAIEQAPVNSQELLLRQSARENARQALRLGFEFARAEAEVLSSTGQPAPSTSSVQGRNLAQAASSAAERAANLEGELGQIRQQLQSLSPGDAQAATLEARRDAVQAELDLVSAQREALKNLTSFVAGAENGENAGLSQKIADLERSVPEAQAGEGSSGQAAAAAASGSSAPAPAAESRGIFSLISEMLSLSERMSELSDLSNQAARLQQDNEQFRTPIRAEILAALRRGSALSTTQASDQADAAALDARRQQLEAVAARFKRASSAGVPLGEQSVVLEAARQDLASWRAVLARQYAAAARSLLIRVGFLVLTVLGLFFLSGLWRRATFRYVHDPRRRRQLMLLRRFVVGFVVLLIVVGSAVTEFGSLATFAGLITAGVAVALQTVILSGVAYFFFIGRFGVRVGDRVTISGITGDVVELGLFRLYLIELAGSHGDLHPTGRIVVFSNSVLFQPSAFYKQIPGADYVWHEVSFTLAPDTDYRLAENRLLGAVESVFAEYRPEIERQHAAVSRSMQVQLGTPKPESRLRFVDAGLEFVVRFPVDLRHASETDDRITRALLGAIDKDPKLRLVPTSPPKIQPAA